MLCLLIALLCLWNILQLGGQVVRFYWRRRRHARRNDRELRMRRFD